MPGDSVISQTSFLKRVISQTVISQTVISQTRGHEKLET